MSRRIDYYDDPDAPKANSLVPSVNVVVVNDAGEILMIRRRTTTTGPFLAGRSISASPWLKPRFARPEESGIECEITGLVGIYSDPKHVHPLHQQRRGSAGVLHRPYRSSHWRPADAEQRIERGALGPVSEVPEYTMDRSMRIRIRDYLDRPASPVLI